jgi:4-aminobutyrate aminotransferase / (S)-3-amino-2-methylpropionate transaminase / 5-aminovalerate transaminase
MYRLPFPYEYRPPIGTAETVGVACAEYAADVIDSQLGFESVAAVIIETVQGEGGYIPAPKDFMTALRDICSERDIMLIDDEIQTGMGRTGEMWGIDHYGVVPDIITSAKSLAAGLPLSSITGPSEVMDAPHVGGLGGTYGGNPVACAAALAVLGELSEGDLLARARWQGQHIRSRIDPLRDELELVGDVRGLGPMIGIELVLDKQTKEPAKLAAAAVIKACFEAGVLVLKAGTYDNVVRLMAPLVISEDDLDEGLDVLIGALRAVDEAA